MIQVLLSYVGGNNISSNLVAGSLSALPSQVQFNPYQNILYVNISLHQNHICGPQDLNAALGATISVRVSSSASKTATTILDVDTVSIIWSHTKYGLQTSLLFFRIFPCSFTPLVNFAAERGNHVILLFCCEKSLQT